MLWEEIKDEMAPQMLVTLQFLFELIFASLRDEIEGQPAVISKEISNYRKHRREDEMGATRGTP